MEDSGNSPTMVLEETVGRLQRDLEELQLENRFLKTPKAVKSVPLVRQAAFTTTKVPWFDGSTSWEQYLQVFEATAALQLLSHLQGDALSVALLTPLPLQATRKELTDALSSHYGSPGRLANYRREFDKTVREMGEDPSNFAIKLETLAVKAFGNMGQVARLRLIHDRFIAGHANCDLRRYWIVSLRIHPYATSWIVVGFGKVMDQRRRVVSVNQFQIRFIRRMWWSSPIMIANQFAWYQ